MYSVESGDTKGFIVSDWMDIERCVGQHHTARDNKDAFCQSILAGMDMHVMAQVAKRMSASWCVKVQHRQNIGKSHR